MKRLHQLSEQVKQFPWALSNVIRSIQLIRPLNTQESQSNIYFIKKDSQQNYNLMHNFVNHLDGKQKLTVQTKQFKNVTEKQNYSGDVSMETSKKSVQTAHLMTAVFLDKKKGENIDNSIQNDNQLSLELSQNDRSDYMQRSCLKNYKDKSGIWAAKIRATVKINSKRINQDLNIDLEKQPKTKKGFNKSIDSQAICKYSSRVNQTGTKQSFLNTDRPVYNRGLQFTDGQFKNQHSPSNSQFKPKSKYKQGKEIENELARNAHPRVSHQIQSGQLIYDIVICQLTNNYTKIVLFKTSTNLQQLFSNLYQPFQKQYVLYLSHCNFQYEFQDNFKKVNLVKRQVVLNNEVYKTNQEQHKMSLRCGSHSRDNKINKQNSANQNRQHLDNEGYKELLDMQQSSPTVGKCLRVLEKSCLKSQQPYDANKSNLSEIRLARNHF